MTTRKLIELGASIDAAICAADEYDGGYNFERDRKIRDALMALPTVDAVEVVRCRDCKYWDTVPGSTFAPMHHQCKVIKLMSTGTWYCASGERKGGEQP